MHQCRISIETHSLIRHGKIAYGISIVLYLLIPIFTALAYNNGITTYIHFLCQFHAPVQAKIYQLLRHIFPGTQAFCQEVFLSCCGDIRQFLQILRRVCAVNPAANLRLRQPTCKMSKKDGDGRGVARRCLLQRSSQ